jgi:hypothetical protein
MLREKFGVWRTLRKFHDYSVCVNHFVFNKGRGLKDPGAFIPYTVAGTILQEGPLQHSHEETKYLRIRPFTLHKTP